MRELSFDLREFGLAMQQWHAGQGDPIYAVGSSCFAELPENLDPETIEAAQSTLERLARDGGHEDASELAAQCGELLECLWPVTYGSGMPGCLYDNGPHRAQNVDDAISDLVQTFYDALEEGEEARMREALSRGSGACHVFENQKAAGAHYCEVSF
jgi:hypothetical protein